MELEFRGVNAPSIVVKNTSEVVVYQPKYGPMLFNVDAPADERLNPLPIPTQTSDFIRPGRNWGPSTFFGLSRVKARLAGGDRVLGVVTVTCPDCMRDRVYWLYAKIGEAGWYAEMDGFNPYALARLLDSPDTVVEAFHAAVPSEIRVAFSQSPRVNED